METPSSTRRMTRSQTAAASNNKNIPISKKIEDSDQAGSNSKLRQRNNGKQHQERSALIDITNDSPIVGLAAGSLRTPSSSVIKTRTSRPKSTPGSGEALLRCQVKTLLQKVEEEAELSKLSLERHPFPSYLQGFVNSSPMGLLAPTPANTPQLLSITVSDSNAGTTATGLAAVDSSQLDEEQHMVSEVVNDIFDGKPEGSLESQKSLITRSLLLDFSDKSETTDSSECLSVVSYQGAEIDSNNKQKSSTELDDDSFVWSIQANASTHDDEDDDSFVANDDTGEEEEEEEGCDYYVEAEEETYGGELLDELCIGMNKVCVNEKGSMQFQGKHTRFVYNSDDEIVEVAEEVDRDVVSPNVLRLKGLPTPKGKHMRFENKEEENKFVWTSMNE